MVNDLLAGMAIAEVLTLILALFTLFRQWKNTIAESGAYAIVVAMIFFSFLFQSGFMPGLRYPALAAEALVWIASVRFVCKHRTPLAKDLMAFLDFARTHRVASVVVSMALCTLAARALLVPPAAYHWSRLMPVLHCQLSQGFPPTTPTAGTLLPLYPLNTAILGHLVLRFNTDMGLGLFGFLAYLSIGFSTYALARRYAWPPTAYTAVIVVMSMPRFIYQASSPGGEIIPAAGALFCILALYRLIEAPGIRDLFLLITGIFFSLTEDAACFLLPAILILLAGVMLFRRHGAMVWWHIVRRNKLATVSVVVPVLVFSQVWLFAHNVFRGEKWIGAPAFTAFAYNGDGIQGAGANFFRYLFQAADLTRPVDALWKIFNGTTFTEMLSGLYGAALAPLFGSHGTTVSFAISSTPDEMVAWFGPAGFLLVPPAFIYVLVRGPRRLKATAIALAVYLYALCLVAAWHPANVRYFSIFFACTGFFTAFFLPPWRLTTNGKTALQAMAIFLLMYATAFGVYRPPISLQEILTALQ